MSAPAHDLTEIRIACVYNKTKREAAAQQSIEEVNVDGAELLPEGWHGDARRV